MASKLIVLLSGVLGMFFMYAGVCKLSPMLDKDLHLAMKKHFVNYARVSPLRTNYNIRFRASEYRSVMGSLEVVGGFGLLSMTGRAIRTLAFVMTLIAELFMIHSYVSLGDPVQRYTRVIAAAVLLIVQMLFERWFTGTEESEQSEGTTTESKTKETRKDRSKDKTKRESKKES